MYCIQFIVKIIIKFVFKLHLILLIEKSIKLILQVTEHFENVTEINLNCLCIQPK